MNLSYQPAPQTRTFESWRSIFLATILMVTVAISTFYLSSVQGREPRRHNGPDPNQRRARHPNGLLGRG